MFFFDNKLIVDLLLSTISGFSVETLFWSQAGGKEQYQDQTQQNITSNHDDFEYLVF